MPGLSYVITNSLMYSYLFLTDLKMASKVGERFELVADEELRVEVDLVKQDETCLVELVNGVAEIFGTEMVKDFKYKFYHGNKFSIYTYHGCSVNIYGQNQISPYTSKEHPMIQYLNIHHALETKRKEADDNDSKFGPKVMVVGPQDVGKTTVCRLLVNYAVRQGRRPIFVDLDVGQNTLSVPGTISATLIERPTSIEEGFPQNAPLVYHYGHSNPKENTVLYDSVVSSMAKVVLQRLTDYSKAKKSGAIINTCGVRGGVRGGGYDQLKHIAEAFDVNVIIVLDQEQMYNYLKKDLPHKTVIWLPKSNGVVERTQEQRLEDSSTSIKHYYYGFQNSLLPYTFDVKFSEIKEKIYKIGAPNLPESCMPLGKTADDNQTKLVAVSLTPKDLLNHVLAISHADSKDDLLSTNVNGFVVVTDVNVKESKISVLSPQPKPLPATLLLLSDIKYIDR